MRAMARIRDSVQTCPSIDQFIYEWQEVPHLPEIAKLCIAYQITKAERESVLGRVRMGTEGAASVLRKLENSWIATALRHLHPSERRRDIEKVLSDVTFITFNYDRCVEEYFKISLVSNYAMNQSEADTFLEGIPILHAYGYLGSLPSGMQTGLDFGASELSFRVGARSIRTFMEEIESANAKRIELAMREADKVIFLGCAFHKQNLEVLFPDPEYVSQARAWGTTYKMRSAAVNRAKALLPIKTIVTKAVLCAPLLNDYRERIFDE